MSLSPHEYLRHIIDEAAYLIQRSASLRCEDFLDDEDLKRAFVRSLEIIGEAIKNVPPDIKQKNPHIDWKAFAGMRDKLIHGYFGVNYRIVWDVVSAEVPQLKNDIELVLNNLPSAV